MSEIVIGEAGHHNAAFDLHTLMVTQLLLAADPGGGKTWALKRLIEQVFGRVGILIIDPEGEFAPLRQKLDFFLVGNSKGADTPADVRSASKVALALLANRVSAICDLYEIPNQRERWLALFLEALINAPKNLRRPYLIIVDEAHIFAPEKGEGSSVASNAMRDLFSRGRKRLLCGIVATQRVAKLDKSVTTFCQNRMVGPTFDPLNQERSANELGIHKEKKIREAFYDKIKMADPGTFYVLGRAISRELLAIKTGPITTPHGEEALKFELEAPPPTEKVRKMLAKLGDLPKQAEEEAHTIAELKKQVRELKTQLKAQPRIEVPKPVADPKAIERAINETARSFGKQLAEASALITKLQRHLMKVSTEAGEMAKLKLSEFKQVSGAEIQKSVVMTQPACHPAAKHPRPEASNGDYKLQGPHRKILSALSELRAIGKEVAPREMVAGWSGYSPNSGGFNNPIGNLNTWGLVTYPQKGSVSLTAEGLANTGDMPAPSGDEVRRRILAVCDGPERKILAALLEHGRGGIVPRQQLADESGYEANSGGFNNPLGALRTKGFLDYPQDKHVQAADWLFID